MTKSQVQRFQEDIEEVVERYADDGLKMGALMGTLDIVKLNAYNESIGVEDDD